MEPDMQLAPKTPDETIDLIRKTHRDLVDKVGADLAPSSTVCMPLSSLLVLVQEIENQRVVAGWHRNMNMRAKGPSGMAY